MLKINLRIEAVISLGHNALGSMNICNENVSIGICASKIDGSREESEKPLI